MSMRIVVGVSALLIIVGSFMTWVTVDIGFAQFSTSGMDTVDGKLTAAAGVVVGLAALALGIKGRTGSWAIWVGLGAALFGTIVLLNEYLDVRQRIAEADPGSATAILELGLWITAAGALVALGALARMAISQRTDAGSVATA
jgi:hypothetical protein